MAKRMTTLMLANKDPDETIGDASSGGASGASGVESQESETTEWIRLPLPPPIVEHIEVEQLRQQEAEEEAHNNEVKKGERH